MNIILLDVLLDYKYIKNHYRLIAVDSGRLKESDADPKRIQQIEFVGQLKRLDDNGNATGPGADQFIIVLMILEKIKETQPNFFQGSVNSLIKVCKLCRSKI